MKDIKVGSSCLNNIKENDELEWSESILKYLILILPKSFSGKSTLKNTL